MKRPSQSKSKKSKINYVSKKKAVRPLFEWLEGRTLLAVLSQGLDTTTGKLTVHGDGANDKFTLQLQSGNASNVELLSSPTQSR